MTEKAKAAQIMLIAQMHALHHLSAMSKHDLVALGRAVDEEMLAREVKEQCDTCRNQYDDYC